MTTVTAADAKLKVRIDLGSVWDELKALQEAYDKLKPPPFVFDPGQRGPGGAPTTREGRRRDLDATDPLQEISWGSLGHLAKGSLLNPLDIALQAISMIPEAGPPIAAGIRTGMNVAEYGLPLATGFAEKALKSAGYEKGSIPYEIMMGLIEGMRATTDGIAELRARNDAIGPAFEATKQIALAQVLAGGVPGSKDVAEYGEAFLKIIYARSSLERKVKRFSLEAVGGAAESLFEGMFK